MNLTSLALSRADGVGGSVRPIKRRSGSLAIRFADVTSPSDGPICDCAELGSDGVVDRVLSFSLTHVLDTLELRTVEPGRSIRLVVTGTLIDGTPFQASDCVSVGKETRISR